MSVALETLRERDRRIARERFVRTAARIGSYVIASLVGVIAATPIAYQHGVESERERVADLPKIARSAPMGGLTQWKCDAVERREYLNTCANRARQSLQIPKEQR